MTATIRDIVEVMERMAPTSLAEDWDNVGLQVGRYDWPAGKIRVALDATDKVVYAACSEQINLLITHHPLIFSPLKRLDLNTHTGRIIHAAIKNQLAIFCAHTNLDAAPGGLNDILAERLGLKNTFVVRRADPPASQNTGLGRVGSLSEETTLEDFARQIRDRLGLDRVRVAGNPGLRICRAVVCCGSGRSLLEDFLVSDAQVYVSGDLGYHHGRRVEAEGRALIDIGHFASEQLMVDSLTARLKQALSEKGYSVEVTGSGIETDCFYYL